MPLFPHKLFWLWLFFFKISTFIADFLVAKIKQYLQAALLNTLQIRAC